MFEKLIPADHSLRRLKAASNFEPFRAVVAECSVTGRGAPATDRVRRRKLRLWQFQYARSESPVLGQAQVKVAFGFFLACSLESPLPVPRLLSQFRTRLGVERGTRVVNAILGQGRVQGLGRDRRRWKEAPQVSANSARSSPSFPVKRSGGGRGTPPGLGFGSWG